MMHRLASHVLLLVACLVIGLLGGAPVSTPVQAQAPSWAVDPAAYASTMTLTGAVFAGGERAGGPGDLVAAFAGDEVRGVAEATPLGDAYVFFLTIYGDAAAEAASGDTLAFEHFDAAAGTVRPLAEALRFETNAVYGTASTPYAWTVRGAGAAACATGPPAWSVTPSAYPSTMTITAAVSAPGYAPGPENRLAAFVAGEVRGVAEPVDVGGQETYFLTVYGALDGETVTFQAYEAARGVAYGVEETLAFQTNAQVGSVSTPLMLSAVCASATTQETPLPARSLALEVFPQPTHGPATVRLVMSRAGPVRVRLYDALGRETMRVYEGWSAGVLEQRLRLAGLPGGWYVLHAETPEGRLARPVLVAR